VRASTEDLDQLVAAVLTGRKYARVDPGLIRAIGAAELPKRAPLKDAIKATKNKLHQVAGMYVGEGALPYARWLEELRAAAVEERPAAVREVAREVMRHHASTRERLPELETFYATILADLGPIRSVLDLACGLNPLAAPWMPLTPGATYRAVDVFADMMAFIDAAMPLLGLAGTAEARDVLRDTPSEPVDVALLLKAIPCLEQQDRSAVARLLDTIRAQHLVVSFPTRTVGGRNVGMRTSYEEHFRELVAGGSWRVARFELGNELVFRLSIE
jgi:16S rRNA (guanine(1405)-N(7))-methyltransferase